MSNMSYCRFENTLSDMNDCLSALQDEEEMAELSGSEKSKAEQMATVAQELAEALEHWKLCADES